MIATKKPSSQSLLEIQPIYCPKCNKIPILSLQPSPSSQKPSLNSTQNPPNKSPFIKVECPCSSEITSLSTYLATLTKNPTKFPLSPSSKILMKRCVNHPNQISINFCKEENLYLCPECSINHKKSINSESHTLEKTSYIKECQVHKENFINCYCMNCKKEMCKLCLEEHCKYTEHDVISIDNFFRDEKIFFVINKYRHMKNEINSYYKNIKNKFIECLDKMKNSIEREYNNLFISNSQVFKFFQILLENYLTFNNDYFILSNFLCNSKFKLVKFNNEYSISNQVKVVENYNCLIDYFKSTSILLYDQENNNKNLHITNKCNLENIEINNNDINNYINFHNKTLLSKQVKKTNEVNVIQIDLNDDKEKLLVNKNINCNNKSPLKNNNVPNKNKNIFIPHARNKLGNKFLNNLNIFTESNNNNLDKENDNVQMEERTIARCNTESNLNALYKKNIYNKAFNNKIVLNKENKPGSIGNAENKNNTNANFYMHSLRNTISNSRFVGNNIGNAGKVNADNNLMSNLASYRVNKDVNSIYKHISLRNKSNPKAGNKSIDKNNNNLNRKLPLTISNMSHSNVINAGNVGNAADAGSNVVVNNHINGLANNGNVNNGNELVMNGNGNNNLLGGQANEEGNGNNNIVKENENEHGQSNENK